MNRLFLATSFSGHVNYETGEVNSDYREKVEAVIHTLRTVGGFTVFCAVEHENWVIASDVPPEVGVENDLAEIDESDVVLALVPTGLISAGQQYEVGYSDAKGKQVILATESGTELAYFNQGVANLGRVAHIEYDTPEDLVANVQQVLA
jgi:nucleoside 2-deoxyribosyltransferase